MTQRKSVVVDCDPGIDDALALLLATASPELHLMAVTCVAGNRPVATTADNARRVLNAAAAHDVPVYAGCSRPMAYRRPRCNLVHGDDGLGGVHLPAGRPPADLHAVDYLVDMLTHAEVGGVTIVAIGPLTNLALAELRCPGVLRRAASLEIMGGAAYCPGNITASAEFNFYADALAARVVLGAGARVRLFGLDVTSKAAMTDDWIASFAELQSAAGRAAHRMLQAYAAMDPLLHDACPIAGLIEPGLFAWAPHAVTVEWRNAATEGKLDAWPQSHPEIPFEPNVDLVMGVDTHRLLSLVRERIGHFV